MTLYLKYRPQAISDLDLPDVRHTLENIVKSGKIPHAFLFIGPKGTGKTSSARILAKAINCEKPGKNFEPCNKCDQCVSITKGNNIDVIEMDAASNRGIDDIRVLRENIKLAPAKAGKKIYIIDEAHMLTTEASNALLKTLEEPPAHVVFILATTNPEKLPSTISSRMTTVIFNKASKEEIMSKLGKIASSEKIKITPEALEIIAQASDGSFRDAVKNLELLSLQSEDITVTFAKDYLYQENLLEPDRIIGFILKKDSQNALLEVERVAQSGGSLKLYMDQIILRLHNLLVSNVVSAEVTQLSVDEISNFISNLVVAKTHLGVSPVPQLPLELAIIKSFPVEKQKVSTTELVEEAPKKKELNSSSIQSDIPWGDILTNIKTKNASIEALLRASQPMSFDGKTLTLGVYYKFHKERLEAATNRKTLEEVLATVWGTNVIIDCVLTEKPQIVQTQKEVVLEEPQKDLAQVAKEIFGA